MFHNSIILSLKIVKCFDLAASDFKLWQFLWKFSNQINVTMNFKVQSAFPEIRCGFYQEVNLVRWKHGKYCNNFTKDFEGEK